MEYKDVQTFLAVRRTGSISKAAQELCLTQSAVSQRIHKLEEDLEIQLLVRNKGKRGVELTPQGEQFVPIAEQWSYLNAASYNIKKSPNRICLKVGGVDSVNCHLLPAFYKEYLDTNPLVDLDIYTYNSWDIYDLMEIGQIDIGIAHTNMTRRQYDIDQQLLFGEPYVVLLPVEHSIRIDAGAVHPSSLNPAHEAFAGFDLPLREWHDQCWPYAQPRMIINGSIDLLILPLLSHPEGWSVVPLSVAKSMARLYPVTWYSILEGPPERRCYFGTRKHLSTYAKETVSDFLQQLKRALAEIQGSPAGPGQETRT